MDAIFDSYSPQAGTDLPKVKQQTIECIQGAIFCNGLRDNVKPFVINQAIDTLENLKKAAARVEANTDRRQKSVRKEHLVMPISDEEVNAIRKNSSNQGRGRRFMGSCHYCKKPGHMIKDCFAKRNADMRARNGQGQGQSQGQFKKKPGYNQVAGVDSQSVYNDDLHEVENEVNALDVSTALNALLA